jgi:hypothetical protein
MRKKLVKSWIEILYREDGVPWAGLQGVRPGEYRVRGGPLPVCEFQYLCEVFEMFREIPEGMEDWFERPIRTLDVLMVCQIKHGAAEPTCVPSLVVSARDIRQYAIAAAGEHAPQRMTCCTDHFTLKLPSAHVWSSRLKLANEH